MRTLRLLKDATILTENGDWCGDRCCYIPSWETTKFNTGETLEEDDLDINWYMPDDFVEGVDYIWED